MLYEAAILVCLSVSPDTCQALKDTRGPHETKEACKERVDEMAEFATKVHLFELNISWQCKSVSGQNDESTSPDTEEEGTKSPTGKVPRLSV